MSSQNNFFKTEDKYQELLSLATLLFILRNSDKFIVSKVNYWRINLDLPSFLWLWKIAAWAMGLTIAAYGVLLFSGSWMYYGRVTKIGRPYWLRNFHYTMGIIIIFLVLLLLAIGLVGTLGYYGSLGHSSHLNAGLIVVVLIFLSGWSAKQINSQNTWARIIHISINTALFFALVFVSWTGWDVVQKYL